MRRSPQLTFANVTAMVALFVALGGTSYAVTRLPSNSVGTKQIKRHAVTLSKLSTSATKSLRGKTGHTGATGPEGPAGQSGAPGARGPAGPSGPTVLTQPAAWVLHSSAPQSDSVTADGSQSDTSGDAQRDGFKFGGFGGPFTATGQMQELLYSPSTLSSTPVRLSSVSFCYLVGPYPPGNTLTNTVINHVWVYQLNETDTGNSFPPSTVTTLLDKATSLANKSAGCPTYNLPAPPPISAGAYLFLRVQVVDTQSNSGDTSGALAQLGRVAATYTP